MEIFQVDLYLNGKFDFILPDRDISKNLGDKYYSGIKPTDEEYDDMIVNRQTNDQDELIYKYLNMKLIFDAGTNDERRGTVVKHSQVLNGGVIGCLHTKPFFDTCEYEVEFIYGN